jgi:hypothetical protein
MKEGRIFAIHDGAIGSVPIQIVHINRDSIVIEHQQIQYRLTSDFNILNFAFKGHTIVVFMVIRNGRLYPIQFPGRSELDLIKTTIPIDRLLSPVMNSPVVQSLLQEKERLKEKLQEKVMEMNKMIENPIFFTAKQTNQTNQGKKGGKMKEKEIKVKKEKGKKIIIENKRREKQK